MKNKAPEGLIFLYLLTFSVNCLIFMVEKRIFRSSDILQCKQHQRPRLLFRCPVQALCNNADVCAPQIVHVRLLSQSIPAVPVRKSTAFPASGSSDSVFSCDPPVASSGAHPFISARRAAMAWRVSCTLFTPASPGFQARFWGKIISQGFPAFVSGISPGRCTRFCILQRRRTN